MSSTGAMSSTALVAWLMGGRIAAATIGNNTVVIQEGIPVDKEHLFSWEKENVVVVDAKEEVVEAREEMLLMTHVVVAEVMSQ